MKKDLDFISKIIIISILEELMTEKLASNVKAFNSKGNITILKLFL